MPSDGGINQVVQLENANDRDPSTIHSHLFKGAGIVPFWHQPYRCILNMR